MRYAAAMTQTPVLVSDEQFAQLRSHFGEKQLVELTSAIAWEITGPGSVMRSGLKPRGFRKARFAQLRITSYEPRTCANIPRRANTRSKVPRVKPLTSASRR